MLDVVIVGAGISGLVCALELQRRGLSVLVVEAADQVGGRMRTDRIRGFLLDRGFQVLLTAYPEAKRYLDYEALNLKKFLPGAFVRVGSQFYEIADPMREVSGVIESAFAPVGTLADKLRIVRLSAALKRKSLEQIANSPETTTEEYLQRQGFSPEMITRFFRPFFGGIFLERDLNTSSRKFEFVFRMFAEGFAAVPAAGMQMIPEQIAGRLPDGAIRTGTRVAKIGRNWVQLADGERIDCRAVVAAVDGRAITALMPQIPAVATVATTCLYFVAPHPPMQKPMLVLNGNGEGLINHLAVMSNVAPTYARVGESLISVTLIGRHLNAGQNLETVVRSELTSWFGAEVRDWTLLATYEIENALPLQTPNSIPEVPDGAAVAGIFTAGDYRENASTNGAMKSGRLVAEAVLEHLGVRVPVS